MPLPLVLGAAAAVAGVLGAGNTIHGVVKIKQANDAMGNAKARHTKAVNEFQYFSKITSTQMDVLGKKELEILNSFKRFSDAFEKIQNRPEFKEYKKENVQILVYDAEVLKEVSIGAGVLLGGIGGAALGTAGGFAAAGATTSAVMALGTASTGTAIASLSGAAATNATLAALGGGSIAAGGGGMALGTTILGATTLGAGIFIGGVIFNMVGSKLSDKADKALEQAIKVEKEVADICKYMRELRDAAYKFEKVFDVVSKVYREHLKKFRIMVMVRSRRDWNTYTQEEKTLTENTALLVGLLYNMCKVKLVLQSENKTDLNRVNNYGVNNICNTAMKFLTDKNIPLVP